MGMKLAFDTRVNPVVREKVERKNLKEWGDNRQARGLPLKGATKLRKYHDVIMNAKKAASKEGITDKTLQDRKAEEAVVEWFEDIGKTKGFVLTEQSSLETSGYRQESLRKVRNKTIKFSSVDLSGTIIVTDPKLFLELLYSGLGHARSFGCGMMMVRRL